MSGWKASKSSTDWRCAAKQPYHRTACTGGIPPGLFVYVEPAPVETQGSAVSPADIEAAQTCYDTATLLPNVLPLLATVPLEGCKQDIIVSPLSTLLAIGAPLGLTESALKARRLCLLGSCRR